MQPPQPVRRKQVIKLIAGVAAFILFLWSLPFLGIVVPYMYDNWKSERRREQAKQQAYEQLSAEDKALVYKFRALGGGGALIVDAFGEKHGVNIFDDRGYLIFARAAFAPGGNFKGSYGAEFGVPKTLRVEWRDPAGDWRLDGPNGAANGGTILGNYTVPVASRIPDALLEDLRKNGGGFRLKIRIHEDGVLIGWDIQRAYGSAPDGSREHQVGGDFREAHGIDRFDKNGRIGPTWAKGWYIHPKTGQRIETDF